jgi:hypothetical protein
MQAIDFILDVLFVIGGIGFCLTVVSIALILMRGGWEQAMAKPIEERGWPAQRWLFLAGTGCMLALAVCGGLLVLVERVFFGRQ